jgi:hypothetical protein
MQRCPSREPAIVSLVDTSEIEAWTLRVVERLRSGGQLEDRRVELKREWPKPEAGSYSKTARQLAALANANHPENVLWLVGLDEKRREVVGAGAVETARWWSMVGSCFGGDPPDLADVVVAVGDKTVVALCFGTATAPYVVKNPLHGTAAGQMIASEVPWREGTSVQTIRKHELRALLMPRPTLPEIMVHSASLSLFTKMGNHDGPEKYWSGEMIWSVESLVPKRLTLPQHRMSLGVELPNQGYSAPLEPYFIDARELSRSDGTPDVRYVGDYVIIDGPGMLRTLLRNSTEPPTPPPDMAGPAIITLTMLAPSLPTPIVIQANLDQDASRGGREIGKWILSKPVVAVP